MGAVVEFSEGKMCEYTAQLDGDEQKGSITLSTEKSQCDVFKRPLKYSIDGFTLSLCDYQCGYYLPEEIWRAKQKLKEKGL